MALLGIYPEARFKALGRLDLRTARALRVRVAYVKRLACCPGASCRRVSKTRLYIFGLSFFSWTTITSTGALPGLTSACCVPALSASSHIALPASSL